VCAEVETVLVQLQKLSTEADLVDWPMPTLNGICVSKLLEQPKHLNSEHNGMPETEGLLHQFFVWLELLLQSILCRSMVKHQQAL
jgi:hypothetical protein